jgi:Flp pilus assembly protein TadG
VTGGTTTVLGVFHAPGTGGWGNNALVPLQDAATTNTVVALDLSGTKTWRFNLANGDYDYLLLAPALETAPEFTGVTKNTDGTITVTWTGGGTLEVTPSLSPVDWQPVAGAVSPYTFTPQAGVNTLFGRIRQ